MRRILVVLGLALSAACAPHASTGPAWPKASEADHDGGESIEPHESKESSVAVEKGDEDAKPTATPVATPVIAPSAQGVGGTTAAPAAAPAQTPEDPIMTDDIVIEIED